MRFNVTVSGLDRLVSDLDKAPERAHRNSLKAVEFTANGIKRTARATATGISYAPDYPRKITYDVDDRGVGDGASAEIGPDKALGGQAPLGVFLEYEYGTPWSAPRPHLGPALDRWTPDFVKGQEIAVVDALEGS
ncbi:hypothetical protein ABZ793_12205 [Micromonospora sp. NPDC047465]|uniref:hypothetical protein n=1 Tax=Micromonospora sp. NPDC047465 TaxID=3154813 RepID=UPI0033C2D1A4